MSIGEGFGCHGDDLTLPHLLQFHVGISTPRYGARDHFVVVVIAKKWRDKNNDLQVSPKSKVPLTALSKKELKLHEKALNIQRRSKFAIINCTKDGIFLTRLK